MTRVQWQTALMKSVSQFDQLTHFGRVHDLASDSVTLKMLSGPSGVRTDQPTAVFHLDPNTPTHVGADHLTWNVAQQVLQVDDWIGIQKDGDQTALHVLTLKHRDLPSDDAFQLLHRRAQGRQSIRAFFEERGFLEVETPTLVQCPGTEPTLDPFLTQLQMGSRAQNFALPTSPEIALKKLLCRGSGPIFEMKNCFRNGELTPLHQPEFLMLEWYRPFENLGAIQKDCEQLIAQLCTRFRTPPPRRVTRVAIAELFKEYLAFELTPITTADELLALCRSHQIDADSRWSFDDFFHLLMMQIIEPRLPTDELTFVENYPPSQAALAKVYPSGWAARFELYWQGKELANAFWELTDPMEQRSRAKADNQAKILSGRTPVQLDEDFFQHLEWGLPPTAGIALGVDRLFMCLWQARTLTEVRAFSVDVLD